MNVTIHFFGPFRDVVGEKTRTFSLSEDATVRDALDVAVAETPELEADLFSDGTLDHSATITRNGRSIRLAEGAKTSLDDGDTLRVSPPIHGG